VKNLSNALSWGIIRNILLVGESLHSYCYYCLSLKADLLGNDFWYLGKFNQKRSPISQTFILLFGE